MGKVFANVENREFDLTRETEREELTTLVDKSLASMDCSDEVLMVSCDFYIGVEPDKGDREISGSNSALFTCYQATNPRRMSLLTALAEFSNYCSAVVGIRKIHSTENYGALFDLLKNGQGNPAHEEPMDRYRNVLSNLLSVAIDEKKVYVTFRVETTE